MSRYTHWVCFDCRKSFHYLPVTKAGLVGGRTCSECGKAMCDMGVYFEPPPARAKKAWAIMELLSRSGYRAGTEGGKALLDSLILSGRRHSLNQVRQRIELLSHQAEHSRIKAQAQKHKTERRSAAQQARIEIQLRRYLKQKEGAGES